MPFPCANELSRLRARPSRTRVIKSTEGFHPMQNSTSAIGGADLDALYAPPGEMVQRAVTSHLTDFHLNYLACATFFCMATGSDRGLDTSPRGGPPGFVRALDRKTLAFADWAGNNRIKSMRNLAEDDRIGLLFIFPGLEIFMRANGHAQVVTNPVVLAAVAEAKRTPKSAIVVRVDEVLFHCGKAINRAQLWSEDARIDRRTLPSPGVMMKALAQVDEMDAQEFNKQYDYAMRHDLFER